MDLAKVEWGHGLDSSHRICIFLLSFN